VISFIVGCSILVVILLKTVSRGGDWFDFLESKVRFDQARTDWDFKFGFTILCVIVFGGGGLILLSCLANDEPKPVFITDVDPTVMPKMKHQSSLHATKGHQSSTHQTHTHAHKKTLTNQ
jgi:hypothetical protein